MINKNIITNLIALATLTVVAYLLWGMAARVEKKLAFVIDGVELGTGNTLTIGRGSDICFSQVPKDYMTIATDGDGFRWKINDQYQGSDSLQYFKINNVNPNAQTIINSTDQLIKVKLYTSQKNDSVEMTFTGADIYRTWNNFSDQENVLVRHYATYYSFAEGNASHTDSTKLFNQMQQHYVRSFFHRDGEEIVMIILDKNTEIHANKKLYNPSIEGDTIIKYIREGLTSSIGDEHRACKVQFFSISDHCYKINKQEDKSLINIIVGYVKTILKLGENSFNINGVNYVMKPSVKLTEWGAGHVIVRNIGRDNVNRLVLYYPRPITFVGTIDTLAAKATISSGLITLKQNNNSFPTKSDLYLPTFSNAINFDLCNLEFLGDSVRVRDNNFNSITLKEVKYALTPTLTKIKLHSGSDTLLCRIGYIGQHFIFSYIYLTLIVAIVLLCLIWLPFSPIRHYKAARAGVYNPYQIEHYPSFLTLLLFTAVAYCACKSLIALKLSYTYPYFEKLTGIVPVSTAMMILIFFSMAMVLSMSLLKQKRIGSWIFFSVCVALLIGLSYAFFVVLDGNVSHNVLQSYFDSETITWKLWKWNSPKMVGINDTHRSVVYTQMLVEASVLALWLAMLTTRLREKIVDWSKKLTAKWEQSQQKRILKWVRNPKYIRWCLVALVTIAALYCAENKINWSQMMSLDNWSGKLALLLTIGGLIYGVIRLSFVTEAFIRAINVILPWHLIVIILLVFLGKILGNFATAFITLLVIIGLSKALSDVVSEAGRSLDKEKGVPHRYVIIYEMLIITLLYIAGAMWGDNGYFTNFLGFIMCVICFFFIVKRPKSIGRADTNENKNERTWVKWTGLIFLACILSLPYLCSILFSPEKVDYSRMSRRLMLYSNFDDLQKSGYRYSESDAEFMVIMSHYMQQQHSQDPLSNDTHFLHASVSSGQSPVVLNDLSVPIAFFGAYGVEKASIVYFLLLALLMWIVLRYSLGYQDIDARLATTTQWRLLALLMWVGTSLYIYFSYIDWLPFTGRLNPGLGVDSVGEVLETAFLLAFMGAVSYKRKDKR